MDLGDKYLNHMLDFYDKEYIMQLLKTRNFMTMLPTTLNMYIAAYTNYSSEGDVNTQDMNESLRDMETNIVEKSLKRIFKIDNQNVKGENDTLSNKLNNAFNRIMSQLTEKSHTSNPS